MDTLSFITYTYTHFMIITDFRGWVKWFLGKIKLVMVVVKLLHNSEWFSLLLLLLLRLSLENYSKVINFKKNRK